MFERSEKLIRVIRGQKHIRAIRGQNHNPPITPISRRIFRGLYYLDNNKSRTLKNMYICNTNAK